MEARMRNPAMLVPGAVEATQALWAAAEEGGVPPRTLELVHLRTSQINGCSVCLELARQKARKSGEADERLFALVAWRDAPFFSDEERAALALTEAVTRLCDRADPVPDAVWEEAVRHYEERTLASLIVAIATVNVWNRLNVSTRQVPGAWG